MKRHVKVYVEAFGYGEQDLIPCEICKSGLPYAPRTERAVDVHHIISRGMGGSTRLDVIDNLIGVCRSCHLFCHGPYSEHWRQICQGIVAQRKLTPIKRA